MKTNTPTPGGSARPWFKFQNLSDSEAEVLIYDDIGLYAVGAEDFTRELSASTADTIHVRINSNGGDVFEGFAIYNALRRHPANIVTHVDGLAASAATYPMLAGDTINIAPTGMVMIHNPASIVWGEAADMRAEADVLDKLRGVIANLYVTHSGQAANQITGWMDAETWFTAEEAKTNGFVTAIVEDPKAKPAENFAHLRNRVLNQAAGRVPGAQRIKALGLEQLIAPVNAAPKELPMTLEQFKAFAAENLDAIKSLPTFTNAVTEAQRIAADAAKPKNATASELKAAFGDDKDFVFDRLSVDAPMVDHQAAFTNRLKEVNKSKDDRIAELSETIAQLDPGAAGRKAPVNTAVGNDGTVDAAAHKAAVEAGLARTSLGRRSLSK